MGSRRVSLLCRVPDSRALLLAAWTLQCAAKPYWWHGGQPAQATTYRVSVHIKGPRAQDAFTETKEEMTARRRPDAPHASSDTTEADPEGTSPLLRVATAPSASKSHATSTT